MTSVAGKRKWLPEASLTEGSIAKSILIFAIPLFFGQLFQQFYNMVDAWVIGNFADNDAFAAVSSAGSMTFLIIGFFNGIAIGGGVVISRYFGAKDQENVIRAIHTNFLFGILASILSTVVGTIMVPYILNWMKVPENVMPHAMSYYSIYFAGVSTIIMYNICMSIMRSLGDSIHPLYYLILSSLVNVVLDLVFVVGFHWGVSGAAIATVISQGLSAVLCMIRMMRQKDETRLNFKRLRFYKNIMGEVIKQGLPTGVQNAVISLGNMTVQTNINSFGSYAMAGYGAYAKIEGFGFLPITSMSMAMPTVISQNLGAKKYDRAKKSAVFGITFGMLTAELIGIILMFGAPVLLKFFVDTPESVAYGTLHAKTISLFFFLLAFSHCAAGVLRGCGKAFIPMVSMLLFWCGVRIVYVTIALKFVHEFQMISWAYPLTWSLSSILFLIVLLKFDWTKTFEKKKKND